MWIFVLSELIQNVILNTPINRLIYSQMLEHLDKHVGLAHHKDFGWLASCPTNVGTGMRASVHVSLPRIKAHMSIPDLKDVCKKNNLDCRGILSFCIST